MGSLPFADDGASPEPASGDTPSFAPGDNLPALRRRSDVSRYTGRHGQPPVPGMPDGYGIPGTAPGAFGGGAYQGPGGGPAGPAGDSAYQGTPSGYNSAPPPMPQGFAQPWGSAAPHAPMGPAPVPAPPAAPHAPMPPAPAPAAYGPPQPMPFPPGQPFPGQAPAAFPAAPPHFASQPPGGPPPAPGLPPQSPGFAPPPQSPQGGAHAMAPQSPAAEPMMARPAAQGPAAQPTVRAMPASGTTPGYAADPGNAAIPAHAADPGSGTARIGAGPVSGAGFNDAGRGNGAGLTMGNETGPGSSPSMSSGRGGNSNPGLNASASSGNRAGTPGNLPPAKSGQAEDFALKEPKFIPSASAAPPTMPNPVADDESLGSWFNSTSRTPAPEPAREPERAPAEPFFQERRVPGQSLQSARAEDTARPARFEQAAAGLNAEPADFGEPTRAAAQAPRTPPRFAGPSEGFGDRPVTEQARPSSLPPVGQASGYNGDSRGTGPRPDFGDETRIDQRAPRFFEDTDPEERTRFNQPRFEPPASPPFGGAPGPGGTPGFNGTPGPGGAPGFGRDPGFGGDRGFNAGPGGAEWTFRDDGGPETGAFQGAYGGNSGQRAPLSEPPGFSDGWGAPRAPGDHAGSFGADEQGFGANSPFGQGWQPGNTEPAPGKKSRKLPVIVGAAVLVVALGAGGAVAAPKFLKHPDPGCTAYTTNALPAYNHAITDLNAKAAQPTLEADVATAVSTLQTAVGEATSQQVRPALQGLLTKLQEVQAGVKAGTVPRDTVSSLNAASAAADSAC